VQQVAAAAFEHARQHRAHRVDMAHHVDLPLPVPNLDTRRQRVAAGGHGGIAEEHVDGPQLALRACHQVVDLRLAADVAGDGQAADLARHGLGPGGVEVDDDDPRALGREGACTGRADAAGRTGDHRDPIR
jgi:hypothetical protein